MTKRADEVAYDVFLSHNRKDKPWVRALWKLFRDAGRRVFFDEEDVDLGANIVMEIEQGMRSSDRILLIISRASLESRWVALEASSVIATDPAATRHRLVPILLEDIDDDSIPGYIRALKLVDLRDRETREASLRDLLKRLNVPTWETVELPRWFDYPDLHVGDIDTIRKWRWSAEHLLEVLIALDYQTLADLDERNEGTIGQWAPIFDKHPQTWRLLYDRPEHVVGYWHFAPLFDEDYERAMTGQLFDSEITDRKIVRLENLDGYGRIYFVQLCLSPEYRHLSCRRRLFASILQVMEELAEEKIFVSDICTNAYSDEGLAHCKTLRLARAAAHEHGEIYCAPIASVLGGKLARTFPKLLALYREEGLLPAPAGS